MVEVSIITPCYNSSSTIAATIESIKNQSFKNFEVLIVDDFSTDNSLEVIKKSSYGIQEKVKILSKVYYKYPDINHRRYRPIIEQLEEIRNRLVFNPSFWEIQNCWYCPINELISEKAQLLFEKIKKIYGITRIFLETYPI